MGPKLGFSIFVKNQPWQYFWFFAWNYGNIKPYNWLQWFYWKESCFYIFRSRWGKMTLKEIFQHEYLMKIFKKFCVEYGGKNLNLVSCFWGKPCTESFGWKGIQLKLMYWVFLILCMKLPQYLDIIG